MVCIVCLLPLFILPFLQLLPQLWDRLMAFFYRVAGYEYKAPVREAPACPYKPGSRKKPSKSALVSTEKEEPQGHEAQPLLAGGKEE